MNDCCVIGNGTSRLQLNLNLIGYRYTTYGCNALYRDYMPDYLISMDIYMVKEILEQDIHLQTNFYTQHDNQIDELQRQGEPINFFWGHRSTIDSGNCAVELALNNQHDNVYMIGFDYSSNDSTLCNVYSGTTNYHPHNQYPAAYQKEVKWIQTLNRLCTQYPDQQIIRVTENKHIDIDRKNYSEITIQQFKDIYERD